MGYLSEIPIDVLRGSLNDLIRQAAQLHRAAFHPEGSWHPSINAYRCRKGFLICVELAGVGREQISLVVEPLRVRVRGQRPPPEPTNADGPMLQLLALEIDHGPFEREVVLPAEVAPEKVHAEQVGGILWIHLPLACKRAGSAGTKGGT